MQPSDILILPYGGVWPGIGPGAVATGAGAAVLGRVTLGPGARLGPRATLRADGEAVRIGADADFGAGVTVHIARDRLATVVGDGVTAGEGCVIHACTVGDGCHLGARAILLDASAIGPGAALAEGAVVFPRTVLEGGWLHAGAPAAPVRPLRPGELAALHRATRDAAGAARSGSGADAVFAAPASGPADPASAAEPAAQPATAAGGAPLPDGAEAAPRLLFQAATARIAGRVRAGQGVGVWFGCLLQGGGAGISIGEDTNLQDNAVLRSRDGALAIGRETTIGHNAVLTDCTVCDRSLIGIGAVVAPGSVVEGDVLLAAGARTEPGQVLAAGGLYGGAPARRLRDLDDARRGVILGTWPAYRRYAAAFAEAQREALRE